MIACKQCGYENDLTRVFCHNCGNRLERTDEQTATATAGITPATQQAPSPATRKVRRPAGEQSENSPGLPGALFRVVVSTAVLAAILACIVQMVRTPSNLPPPAASNDAAAQLFVETLKKASQHDPSLPVWISNAAAINNYLASTVHAISGSNGVITAVFQRAFIILGQGRIRMWLVQTYNGYPVYYSIDVVPVLQNGSMTASIVGGQVGHLPIHPMLAPVMARFFGPLADSLYDPLQALKDAQRIDINPNDVSISWTAGK